MRIADILRPWVPPAVLHLKRRLSPPSPMFIGAFSRPPDVAGGDPWTSAERIAYCDNQLRSLENEKDTPPADSTLLMCALVNLLTASKQKCRVLDFGGGTGFVYFKLKRYFKTAAAVQWTVVDNARLAAIGETYKNSLDLITFHKALPPDSQFEIVFCNTTLQFVADPLSMVEALAKYNAEYIVLTRFVAGEVDAYFTVQHHIHGYSVSCAIVDVRQVIHILASLGYDLVHDTPAAEDQWGPELYQDVPLERQLRATRNVIFRRSG